MKRFQSENSFLQGLTEKSLTVGLTFLMSHPAKNCFPISTFSNLNTILKTKNYFLFAFLLFFGKNFLGSSRNFFTQSWESKVCNTTLWMDPSKICSAFQVIDIPICHYNVISLPRQGINQHSFVLNFPLFLDSKMMTERIAPHSGRYRTMN